MSKARAKWGTGLNAFFGIVIAFLPVSESWKIVLCSVALVGMAVCIVGYFVSEDDAPEKAMQNMEVVAPKQTGNIVTAGGDIHQTIYQGVQNPPQSLDEANPWIVALDDLKQLLREGDNMVQDFYFGHWERYPSEKVNEYIDRVRNCARRRVLQVSGGDWTRFEELWDINEVVLQAAGLCDNKLLPNIFVNPGPGEVFGRLFGRVERLRELLTALTGVKSESPYTLERPPTPSAPAPTHKGEKWSVYKAPTIEVPVKKVIEREVGPKVVPPRTETPKDRHETYERERAAAGIEIHLPLAGQSIRERAAKVISTIEARIDRLNKTLNAASAALDSFESVPSKFVHQLRERANLADLFEVEEELIKESIAVYRESECEAFSELWQSLRGLNQKIADYNNSKTARIKNDIFAWTIQAIPMHLEHARVQSAKLTALP